jgi:hypothetical protein
MVHSSGILITETFRSKLVSLFQSNDITYAKITIEGDAFVCNESGDRASLVSSPTTTDASVFTGLQKVLTSPCYIFFRPFQNTPSKWIFIFFIPLISSIRDRMIYSSSCAILKDAFAPALSNTVTNNDGTTTTSSLSTWNVSEVAECTIEGYFQSIETLSTENLMTLDERIQNESEIAAHLAMGTQKVRAVIDLPIQVSDNLHDKLDQFNNKTKESTDKCNEKDANGNEDMTGEINSIILAMEANEERLIVEHVLENRRWEDVASHLPLNEPRYVLSSLQVPTSALSSLSLNTPSITDSSSAYSTIIIFHYYCPDAIKPKLKMFYSTCKNMVVKFCEANNTIVQKSFEISERNEFNSQTVLSDLNANFTTMHASKKTFSKPSAGRGGSRAGKSRFLGSAFSSPSP